MIYPINVFFFFEVRDGPCWGLTDHIMVLRYLFARHNTQQFHIRGRAREVDAIQNIFPSSPKQLVFKGSRPLKVLGGNCRCCHRLREVDYIAPQC